MEPLQTLSESPILDFSSTVDTSRPFSSVKDAVAIFDERFLVGEIYSPKPPFIDTSTTTPPPRREPSWRFSSSSPMEPKKDNARTLSDTLKKLEAELEEARQELKLLKERESETEVALASLNAELHENKSKLEEAEAAARKAAVARKTVWFDGEIRGCDGNKKDGGIRKEETRELIRKMEESQTSAQIISLGGKKQTKMMKKKPIIPLVGDLFSRKKGSGAIHHRDPLYESPFFYN